MPPAKLSFHALFLPLAIAVAVIPGRVTRADEIDDVPAPLEEATPRTKEEQTHLDALSLFSAGRIEEQKDHLSEALRLYQRALRCDPNALPIIREIVPLAFNLDRPNEAVRYALKAAELDPSDPAAFASTGTAPGRGRSISAGARAVHTGAIESSQPAPQPGLHLAVDGVGPTVLCDGSCARSGGRLRNRVTGDRKPGQIRSQRQPEKVVRRRRRDALAGTDGRSLSFGGTARTTRKRLTSGWTR